MEAEKLVSSFREERGGEDKELGRQGAEVCEKGSRERVKQKGLAEKEAPFTQSAHCEPVASLIRLPVRVNVTEA